MLEEVAWWIWDDWTADDDGRYTTTYENFHRLHLDGKLLMYFTQMGGCCGCCFYVKMDDLASALESSREHTEEFLERLGFHPTEEQLLSDFGFRLFYLQWHGV
jgi:hypothetical protein